MGYGEREYFYAKPFADALVDHHAVRSWVLSKTGFAEHADTARLLHEEMAARRSTAAQNWWRSHFSEACRCDGDKGRETDLLAVFEGDGGFRFAIHFEVKHPGDVFHPGQAAAYPLRAQCWATDGRTPKGVVPHSAATTALLCSRSGITKYASQLEYFGTVITFEEFNAKLLCCAC